MRRLIAVIFLAIYLLSLSGHEIMHQYLEYKSDKLFNEQAAIGHYNVNDLTEVQIPVNMPQIRDWESYVNVHGQIQFGDVAYNYVKLKMTRKIMYVMCLPNYDHTQLFDENIIHANKTSDVPVPKKDHVPYGKITLMGNFNFAFFSYKFIPPVKISEITVVHPIQQLVHKSLDIPEQPPKVAC